MSKLDQSSTLRRMREGMLGTVIPIRKVKKRVLAVTGGKGGVGKSTVAANLAVAFARHGARTLALDGDLGMADLNLLLGVAPTRTMLDALDGTSVADVLVQAHGLHLLPAQNGSYALATMGAGAHRRALELIESLSSRFETIVLDVAAGIGASQTMIAGAAADQIVVVNPEPLSMADAYACLKTLATRAEVRHAYVLPNRVSSRAQADELVARLGALVTRFLDLELTPLPPVPADPKVATAAACGEPLLVHAPDAPAARAIRQLVRVLSSLAPRSTASWWRAARAQGESR